MKTSHAILGLAGAAAAGALIGVLFAPDKGSKTRKKIADKSKAYTDEVKSKFDKMASKLALNGREIQKEILEK